MKSLTLLLLSLIIGLTVRSQVEIKLEDAAKHVGDSVKVCGKVSGIRFMENAKGQPTLINLGAAYPNQLLTVVIWEDLRKQFDKTPEELFKDKEICITGKIELYRDKPQIVIRSKEQVQ
ncbi:MAG: DNA-binding protein [Bacteroidetes bacterium]|nr:MAG: DNA-binding protein [Bacteroidota bacterium]